MYGKIDIDAGGLTQQTKKEGLNFNNTQILFFFYV